MIFLLRKDKMTNIKYDRIAMQLKNKINEIINQKIDDLEFVTVIDLEITKDLQDAKVYINSLMDNQEEYIIKTLEKKEKFIKKELSQSIEIRKIPNLIFKYDNSLDNYNKIDKILKNKN